MKTFRIIAGGHIPDNEIIEVNSGDKIICADRGYEYALIRGIKPHMLIGDFDSCHAPLPEDIEIHRCVPEKDDTDTLLAVKTALDLGAEKIVLYGVLGGRLDHTIANIQTLIYIRRRGCFGEIRSTDNTAAVYGTGEHRLPAREGWYLSIFSMSEETEIKRLRGVKYPLTDYLMTTEFPIGVSNEITADEAVLEIGRGEALVIRSRMQQEIQEL